MATKSRMAQRANIASVDPIWAELRQEAEEAVRNEPALGGFIYLFSLVFLLAAWHGFKFFRSFFRSRGGDRQ